MTAPRDPTAIVDDIWSCADCGDRRVMLEMLVHTIRGGQKRFGDLLLPEFEASIAAIEAGKQPFFCGRCGSADVGPLADMTPDLRLIDGGQP